MTNPEQKIYALIYEFHTLYSKKNNVMNTIKLNGYPYLISDFDEERDMGMIKLAISDMRENLNKTIQLIKSKNDNKPDKFYINYLLDRLNIDNSLSRIPKHKPGDVIIMLYPDNKVVFTYDDTIIKRIEAVGLPSVIISTYENDTIQAIEIFEKMQNEFNDTLESFNKLSPEDKKKALKTQFNEININIQEAPEDVQNYLYLMALYNASRQKQYIEKIEAVGKKALELSPTRPQTYFEMGQAKMMLGQRDEGIAYFKKAVDLAPWAMETHWNLAAAYIMADRLDEADQLFTSLEGYNGFRFDTEQNLSRVMNIYLTVQNKARTQQTLSRLVEINPANGDYWAKLAAVSKELGDLTRAREAALKAKAIDPDKYGQEADAFIEILNSDAQSTPQAQPVTSAPANHQQGR